MYSQSEVKSACLDYFNGDTLATDTWMKKYALRDKDGNFVEKTPDDMHRRLAKEFFRVEKKFSYPYEEDEIYEFLKDFKYIVPQGSPMAGIGNEYRMQSLSNCVVVDSPKDTMSSIVETARDLANLFKRRAGVGVDISTLRPDGTPVNNSAGTSSGAWSFADLYSYITRLVGQGNRRGALMITMDVRHPDIEQFATMKNDMTKVTGANISVKLSDEFMRAVENDDHFILRWPIDIPANEKVSMSEGVLYKSEDGCRKKIKARDLWTKIVDSATYTAEPGILMWDNITTNLPAHEYPEFQTLSTNPCGELPLSPGDSCRLISINLKSFVVNKKFDIEKFREVVKVGMRLSDDLVELELEKLQTLVDMADESEKEIWKKLWDAAYTGRRTGLGTHGLADCLANCEIKYGSEESIKFIDKIYSVLKNVAYDTSIELAVERGTFPAYKRMYDDNAFLNNLDADVQLRMKKHGRRNISLLTNAPTGSVSILSQTSSGIEPVFQNKYTRRRKLMKGEDLQASFTSADGEQFVEYDVYHHNVAQWIEENDNTTLPDWFVVSEEIPYENRIDVQSAIQKHIDHSISSTINLPRGTSPDVVSEIYLSSWKKGLKGVTVYVDGSREGILVTNNKKEDEFEERDYVPRKEELPCHIHHRIVDGEQYVVLVGLMNDKPYEVFVGKEDRIQIPKRYDTGVIYRKVFKTKSNRYDLQIDGDGFVRDIVDVFDNPNNSTLSRMISLSLRYGAKVSHVVEQLQQTHQESSMNCFSRVLARVLKEYIPDETKAHEGKLCPECEQDSLIYVEGCVTCKNCGWSRCM